MSPFRRILKYAKPYRLGLVFSVIFNILYSLLAIVSVTSILPILKILFDNVEGKNSELPPPPKSSPYSFDTLEYNVSKWVAEQMHEIGELKVLGLLCAFTVSLFLFRNLFRYLASYFLIGLRSGMARDLRNALYQKILKLPVAYFTEQRKGDIMSRISSDIDQVKQFTLYPIIELIRSPFMIITTLAMLIYMNAELTLAALIILPIMGFVISSISKSLKKDARRAQAILGKLISMVDETLGASKIIKIFSAEEHLSQRFDETNTDWRKHTNKVERKYELSSPMSELLGSLTLIMLVWYGGKLIIGGSGLKGEEFLMFIGLFFQLLDPAKTLSKSISDISRGNASAERILSVLDEEVVVDEVENPIEIDSFDSEIEFKNVSFQYQKDHPVIKNFNLTIEKGKSVALVGQSGSGKTTIANLLARFYDVTEGEILIDKRPIHHLSLKSYRTLIGMVTQESVLFNDTLFNNIAMGKANSDLEEVKSAAQIANAHEFIEQMPEQYHENIGEGGGKLSGGQKQRVSIARAVLKNPPIMILDEATSALDTHSERLVQEALDHMMENRTSLVIAHRLSTIQNADNIVVMDQGKIIEQGKHDELMSHNGIYAKLIEMQGFK